MIDRKMPTEFVDRLVDVVHVLREDWSRIHIRAGLEAAQRLEVIETPGQFVAAAVNAALEPTFHTARAIAFTGTHRPSLKTVGRTRDSGAPCGECGRPETICRRAEANLPASERHDYEAAQ